MIRLNRSLEKFFDLFFFSRLDIVPLNWLGLALQFEWIFFYSFILLLRSTFYAHLQSGRKLDSSFKRNLVYLKKNLLKSKPHDFCWSTHTMLKDTGHLSNQVNLRLTSATAWFAYYRIVLASFSWTCTILQPDLTC